MRFSRLYRILTAAGFAILITTLPGGSSALKASDLALSLKVGHRGIKDARLQDIYGAGRIFYPSLAWNLTGNLGFELGYETGYRKSGPVGLYQEDSTLTLNGWEAAVKLSHSFGRAKPFIKFGGGYYSYKQDIESEFVRLAVDHHAAAPLIGLGLDLKLGAGVYVSGEIKAVPLKVQPFDVEVDLGGWRFLAGLGYSFDWGSSRGNQ